MRQAVLPLLALADLALIVGLGWLWFTPDGEVKGLQWQPPAAVRPALGDATALPEGGPGGAQYVATLERPLFAPTRRPPPPPQAAASAPPLTVDPPPDVRLLGLYGTRSADAASAADPGTAPAGGMVARIDGQVRRVRVGAAVSGSWVLKTVRPTEAVIARGDEERVLVLRRLSADEAALASADNAGSGAQGAPRPAAANPIMQREVEQARERVRRLNALRARAGIPLLPEP